MPRASHYALFTIFAAALLVASTATAEGDEHSLYGLAGGEFWLGPVNGGHGVARVHWRWEPAGTSTRLDVDFNTDTLRARLGGIPLTERLSVYTELAGEYPFAGLLPDYYRRGRRIPARGFQAGYAEIAAGLEWSADPHFITVGGRGRRWIFGRSEQTASDLRLPPETWVGRARLNYTWWGLESDSSQWEPHQPFMRVEGVAAGLSLGAAWRADDRSWGTREQLDSSPVRANNPDSPNATVRQWFRAGVTVSELVRLQFAERASWGWGEDDLTRDRVGGLNPYVAPVAGLPWAALVSGRYVTGRADVRLTAPADHEFGVFIDGAAVADIRRTGAFDTWTATGGTGLLADLRWGAWKADVRVGASFPGAWLHARPTLSSWLSLGREW
jgi:hypothetical protein